MGVSEGDLFLLGNLGGVKEYHIYHQNWTPAPNHTWVELSHAVLPTELSGMWTWFQRGSGIWMNVGRTLVFPTPADPLKTHAAAIAYLRSGCSMNISYSWPLRTREGIRQHPICTSGWAGSHRNLRADWTD